MCSYCGCESRAAILELMSEHEAIALRVRQASSALAEGDSITAVSACRDVALLFHAHGAKEEAGLFVEWRAEGLNGGVIDRLEDEHRRLEAGLALPAGGDAAGLAITFADLLDHAGREDSDLFPAALQLLSNDAWARIEKVHYEHGFGPSDAP
jgi:hemerythrin-like domain-containing protein